MLKIAITGSLSSGKSTVSKIISKKKYPVFDADVEVKTSIKIITTSRQLERSLELKATKT